MRDRMPKNTGLFVLLDGFFALVRVWTRRKWLAMPVFAAPFLGMVSLALFLPNIYRSSAVVLVERQQVPEEFVKPTVTGGLDTRLQMISQEILSRSRLEALISRFDLYPDWRKTVPAEAVVERLRRDIELQLKGVETRVRGSATVAFTISYRGGDPKTVALIANTLAAHYIEENTLARERQAAGTAEFLRRQLEKTKERLDDQEQRVSEFKKRYMGETPQNLAGNLTILERLNTDLRLNADNQARAMQRAAVLETQLGLAMQLGDAELRRTLGESRGASDSAPSAGGDSRESSDALPGRLEKLRRELAELRTRFRDRYPDIVAKKADIATLERQLAETTTAAPVPKGAAPAAEPKPRQTSLAADAAPRDPNVLRLRQALIEAEGELKTLKDEEKRLRLTVATYQGRVENAPRRELEFQELSRDHESTKDLYRTLLKRYEEAQLAESLEQRQKGEQFRILEAAIPSKEPAAPKRLKLILLALVLSLGLTAGVVMLAEYADTSVHSLDELRALVSHPILASIPRIVTDTEASRMRWQLRLRIAGALVSLALIVTGSYFMARGNETVVSLLMLGSS